MRSARKTGVQLPRIENTRVRHHERPAGCRRSSVHELMTAAVFRRANSKDLRELLSTRTVERYGSASKAHTSASRRQNKQFLLAVTSSADSPTAMPAYAKTAFLCLEAQPYTSDRPQTSLWMPSFIAVADAQAGLVNLGISRKEQRRHRRTAQ